MPIWSNQTICMNIVWIWQKTPSWFFFKIITSVWCYCQFFVLLICHWTLKSTICILILQTQLIPGKIHLLCKTFTLSQQGKSVAKLMGPKLIKDHWRHWLDENKVTLTRKSLVNTFCCYIEYLPTFHKSGETQKILTTFIFSILPLQELKYSSDFLSNILFMNSKQGRGWNTYVQFV